MYSVTQQCIRKFYLLYGDKTVYMRFGTVTNILWDNLQGRDNDVHVPSLNVFSRVQTTFFLVTTLNLSSWSSSTIIKPTSDPCLRSTP